MNRPLLLIALAYLCLPAAQSNASIVVDYQSLGDFSSANLESGGIAVDTGLQINVHSATGLGVGSVDPILLDRVIHGNESVEFLFLNGYATNVVVELSRKDRFVADFDGDGIEFEFTVGAIDVADPGALGFVQFTSANFFDGTGRLTDGGASVVLDVSETFGDAAMSSFSFHVQDSFAVQSITYDQVSSSVPEPASIALWGLGLLGIGGYSLRQRRKLNHSVVR